MIQVHLLFYSRILWKQCLDLLTVHIGIHGAMSTIQILPWSRPRTGLRGQTRSFQWMHISMQNLYQILVKMDQNKRLGTPVIACVISMSRSALIDLTRTDGRSFDNNHFRGDPQQKKLFSLSFTFTDFWVQRNWFLMIHNLWFTSHHFYRWAVFWGHP